MVLSSPSETSYRTWQPRCQFLFLFCFRAARGVQLFCDLWPFAAAALVGQVSSIAGGAEGGDGDRSRAPLLEDFPLFLIRLCCFDGCSV